MAVQIKDSVDRLPSPKRPHIKNVLLSLVVAGGLLAAYVKFANPNISEGNTSTRSAEAYKDFNEGVLDIKSPWGLGIIVPKSIQPRDDGKYKLNQFSYFDYRSPFSDIMVSPNQDCIDYNIMYIIASGVQDLSGRVTLDNAYIILDSSSREFTNRKIPLNNDGKDGLETTEVVGVIKNYEDNPEGVYSQMYIVVYPYQIHIGPDGHHIVYRSRVELSYNNCIQVLPKPIPRKR